jgi:hypothetical protein
MHIAYPMFVIPAAPSSLLLARPNLFRTPDKQE